MIRFKDLLDVVYENNPKADLELLEEVRIQISCSYLVATDRTVTQISSDVGFGSISSFQRSFFKYMNQTPSQFRCSMKSK